MKSPRTPVKVLARVVSLLSPSCKQASRLQSESLDRPLTFFEGFGLRIHLFLCKWCRRYGAQLKFLRSAAHQCEDHQPTHKLSSEARERIKQRLQSEKE
jgi:hypothetical protein